MRLCQLVRFVEAFSESGESIEDSEVVYSGKYADCVAEYNKVMKTKLWNEQFLINTTNKEWRN